MPEVWGQTTPLRSGEAGHGYTPRTMATLLANAIDRAHELDARDSLRAFRERFHLPRDDPGSGGVGKELCYLTGNSLGLMPRRARELVDQELDDWRDLAVEAHFKGKNPWFPYHEQFRASGARLVGAKVPADSAAPSEVVMMNSLTVNLHLMMASFYRPTGGPRGSGGGRFKILIEAGAFPSDEYAVQSQARFHAEARGFDAKAAIVRLAPRPGEATLRDSDITDAIEREGKSLALVLFPGVSYVTGQAFHVEQITKGAHAVGAVAGFDLAHAAGNLALDLHSAGADFAVWCSYKYLNAGPGSLAGAFVHERHFGASVSGDLPRFEGWWSNDPTTRFKMRQEIDRAKGAEAWAVSNPPILSAAPLRASLDIFDEATMPRLREKSRAMTEFLGGLLDEIAREKSSSGTAPFVSVTPTEWARRGCQFSLRFAKGAREIQQALLKAGIVTDFREPDVVRLAPAPLYNSFGDCARFAAALAALL